MLSLKVEQNKDGTLIANFLVDSEVINIFNFTCTLLFLLIQYALNKDSQDVLTIDIDDKKQYRKIVDFTYLDGVYSSSTSTYYPLYFQFYRQHQLCKVNITFTHLILAEEARMLKEHKSKLGFNTKALNSSELSKELSKFEEVVASLFYLPTRFHDSLYSLIFGTCPIHIYLDGIYQPNKRYYLVGCGSNCHLHIKNSHIFLSQFYGFNDISLENSSVFYDSPAAFNPPTDVSKIYNQITGYNDKQNFLEFADGILCSPNTSQDKYFTKLDGRRRFGSNLTDSDISENKCFIPANNNQYVSAGTPASIKMDKNSSLVIQVVKILQVYKGEHYLEASIWHSTDSGLYSYRTYFTDGILLRCKKKQLLEPSIYNVILQDDEIDQDTFHKNSENFESAKTNLVVMYDSPYEDDIAYEDDIVLPFTNFT